MSVKLEVQTEVHIFFLSCIIYTHILSTL